MNEQDKDLEQVTQDTGTTNEASSAVTQEQKDEAAAANTKSYADMISKQYDNYIQQSNANIDYQTQVQQAKAARAYEDAVANYQKQYRDATAKMYNGMDNQALMSDVNGQYGGMATASVADIQSTYQKQRQQLAIQQQQLALDTAREVEDLRAQGEFDKADALLKARQLEAQQLYDDAVRVDENRWSNQQWQTSLDREDAEIQREQENSDLDYQRSMGMAFLNNGILPPDNILSAMGIDATTAQQYINAVQAGR